MDELDPLLLVDIIRRLLAVGVPPTAVANAFDMDPGPIADVALGLRREKYGTAEISEAHAFLHWVAYEELLKLIKFGSPDQKVKAVFQILGKQMAITARQTPEETAHARAAFADYVVLDQEAEDTDDELAAVYDISVREQFVVSETDE